MPLTKKQKQLRASIAHARTFRHLDSAAESSRNSTPAGTTTPSLGTEDLAHLTPPASPENMPKALASVDVQLIRKWEHRVYRWMDAYRAGKNAKDAQLQVRKYGSRQYKSHRRAPMRDPTEG